PYDSEPIYNLALALKYQGQPDEAYERFWKATWSKAWADAGYFEAAKISVAQGRLDDALDELNRGLIYGAHNQKALALKAAVLRKMGHKDAAMDVCKEALKTDLFNYGCRYEMYLLTGDKAVLDEMKELLLGLAKNYDEVALDYSAAGLCEEARAIWDIAIEEGATTPMTYYYLGSLTPCPSLPPQGRLPVAFPTGEGSRYFELAERQCPDYCFPNRPEDVIALETAKRENPQGAKAPYYLGCLYYAARQYNLAIENWELSAQLDPTFPTVWRNLALARFNKQGREQEALGYMEKAFHLNEADERVLMELDQLYKRMQKPHSERLAFLQQYPQLVQRRDDLVLEEITLLNQTGNYKEAMQKLDAHKFHPWEGGEGKVSAQYQICRVELAKQAIAQQRYGEAKRLLEQCLDYPEHLGEGKLYGAQENDFLYLLGCCYDAVGQADKARECWEEATKGPQEPAAAMYYNDAKPDKIFYQGLALLKLGRKGEANGRFHKLVNYGKQHIFEHITMDYFAVSLPDLLIWEDSLDCKNEIHCKYMLALGYYGLGEKDKALGYLNDVGRLDINHQGIQSFKTFIAQ
ncbi:MAG: DUF5107 domain-containing protein, partial [Bacteroidaceae bacterium]|nr:DUF5107 domain-containing protein [Bacteroidaceae bacterium]